jgi:hypothetical protein
LFACLVDIRCQRRTLSLDTIHAFYVRMSKKAGLRSSGTRSCFTSDGTASEPQSDS